MTTLAQPGLGIDRQVLKTIARHNRAEFAGVGMFACLGAYANVELAGTIRLGDNAQVS